MELSEIYEMCGDVNFKEEDNLELKERLKVIEGRARVINSISLEEFLSGTYNLEIVHRKLLTLSITVV